MASTLDVAEDHAVKMKINMYQNLIYLANEYNRRSGVSQSQKIDIDNLRRSQMDLYIEMPCKVAFIG